MSVSRPTVSEPCPVCGGSGSHAYTGRDLLMHLPGEFSYAECGDCGAVYQAPMPDAQRIASFYPDDYQPYRPGREKRRSALERAVLRSRYGYAHLDSGFPRWLAGILGAFVHRHAVPFTGSGRLLDVGCGGGKYLRSMRALGWEPEGVEFNRSAVETCRAAGLKVFQGELSEAGFPDGHFDVVTARHVIEHIPAPVDFVTEIHRILKPGGLMVLMTPNSRALGRGWFGVHWFANDIPRHLVLFSPENLARLAGRAGFEPAVVRTSSTPKIVLNSWDYKFGVRGRPSKKRKLRRILARPYVAASTLLGRGDEIFAIFRKPLDAGDAPPS